jgi:hypothetical protein
MLARSGATCRQSPSRLSMSVDDIKGFLFLFYQQHTKTHSAESKQNPPDVVAGFAAVAAGVAPCGDGRATTRELIARSESALEKNFISLQMCNNTV